MLNKFLLLCLFPMMLFSERQPNYFYDSNQVRYELYQTNGGQPYNWLFFPGGPGADSCYLHSLIDALELPGNVWLIDLPGNGSNRQEAFGEDFDRWIEIFPEVIGQFDCPILVGHSFGGMFPLLFPELEDCLKGFVILNSSPTLWLEEAVAYSKQFNLPDLSKEMREFTLNPSQETFRAALEACMPYYFPEYTLDKGRALLSQVPFQYQPAVWWQRKVIELNFSAKWVPQHVPTLIVGAKYDCICPFALFEKDQRFHRPNIQLLFLEDAGHMGWIENPAAMKNAFREMAHRLKSCVYPEPKQTARADAFFREIIARSNSSEENFATILAFFNREKESLHQFQFEYPLQNKAHATSFFKVLEIKAQQAHRFVPVFVDCQFLHPTHLGFLRRASIANGPVIWEHTLVDKPSKSVLFIEEQEVLPNGEKIEGRFAAFNTVVEKDGRWYFSGTYLYPEKPSAEEIAQREQMFLRTYENMISLIEKGEIDSIYNQLKSLGE